MEMLMPKEKTRKGDKLAYPQSHVRYESSLPRHGARDRRTLCPDDEDRRTFVRTFGRGCERAVFRVHAWVLISNHYHCC